MLTAAQVDALANLFPQNSRDDVAHFGAMVLAKLQAGQSIERALTAIENTAVTLSNTADRLYQRLRYSDAFIGDVYESLRAKAVQ